MVGFRFQLDNGLGRFIMEKNLCCNDELLFFGVVWGFFDCFVLGERIEKCI